MSAQVCCECGKLLETDDLLRAGIIARYEALKSKIHYALQKPIECESVEHWRCSDPKGVTYE